MASSLIGISNESGALRSARFATILPLLLLYLGRSDPNPHPRECGQRYSPKCRAAAYKRVLSIALVCPSSGIALWSIFGVSSGGEWKIGIAD